MTTAVPAGLRRKTEMTVDDLLRAARRLIDRYGHDRDGFGKPSTGLSLEGAVYLAAGFHEGPYDLRDPESSEVDLFMRCNVVFAAIAQRVGGQFVGPGRAYITVIEANERLDSASAVALLDRVIAGRRSMAAGSALYGAAATAGGRAR